MNVLLLAAGMGTRLRPITNNLPKCLVPICGKPLLEWWLRLFNESKKIKTVFINTFYLRGQVHSFIEGYKTKVSFNIVLFDEPHLLGTGGTVRAIYNQIKSKNIENGLLVAHADNLSCFDIKELLSCHDKRQSFVNTTMMTFNTESPDTCGIVELNEENVLVKMHEKVQGIQGKTANGAVFVFDKRALNIFREDCMIFDISLDFIPKNYGKINCYHNNRYHRDIGNLESYNKAHEEFPEILRKCGTMYGEKM